MKQNRFFFLVVIILAVSCTSDDPETAFSPQAFYPLSTGNYLIYSVSETRYSENADPQELQYELLVAIADSFPNSSGSNTYVIHRSKRPSGNDPWEVVNTWSVRVDETEVVVNEENVSYVRITFPLVNNKTWNGNKYNSMSADSYTLSAVNESYQGGSQNFDKTIRVSQKEISDLLFFRKNFEVYAYNIGLVYKEVNDLAYCDDAACFGQKQIKSGVVYQQTLLSYGKN